LLGAGLGSDHVLLKSLYNLTRCSGGERRSDP